MDRLREGRDIEKVQRGEQSTALCCELTEDGAVCNLLHCNCYEAYHECSALYVSN